MYEFPTQENKLCTKDKNEPHEHIMFIHVHVFSRRFEQRKILYAITIILQIIKTTQNAED